MPRTSAVTKPKPKYGGRPADIQESAHIQGPADIQGPANIQGISHTYGLDRRYNSLHTVYHHRPAVRHIVYRHHTPRVYRYYDHHYPSTRYVYPVDTHKKRRSSRSSRSSRSRRHRRRAGDAAPIYAPPKTQNFNKTKCAGCGCNLPGRGRDDDSYQW